MPCHLAHTAYELLLDGWQRCFLLHCLIVFQNGQFQIDHAKHFKVTLNKCCIMWNTDICRTCLVWNYFKYPVTTSPLSNKKQQSWCLYQWKYLLKIDSEVWSALSNKENVDQLKAVVFIKKKKKSVKVSVNQSKMFYLEAFKNVIVNIWEGWFWEQKLVVPKKFIRRKDGLVKGFRSVQKADVIQQFFVVSECGSVWLLRGV